MTETHETMGGEPWLPAECVSDFLAVLEACTVGEENEIGSIDSFTAMKEISMTVLCHARLNRSSADSDPASVLARDVAACAYLILEEQMGGTTEADIQLVEDAGFDTDMIELMDQTQIWMQMIAQPLPELKRAYAEQGIEATPEQIGRMKHSAAGVMMKYNYERNTLLVRIAEQDGIDIERGISPEAWLNWVGGADSDDES